MSNDTIGAIAEELRYALDHLDLLDRQLDTPTPAHDDPAERRKRQATASSVRAHVERARRWIDVALSPERMPDTHA